MEFTEEVIRDLFGYEDAEGEPVERLKAFYFKNKAYKQVLADLPLRLLVGHKGVGKSALFRVAMEEQRKSGNLAILIKPDDIADIGEKHDNILLSINKWKYGLTSIIAEKVLRAFGVEDDSYKSKIIKTGMKVFTIIGDTAKPFFRDKVDALPAKIALMEQFINSKKIVVYLDDLDRGWQNKKEGIIMISALLNAIRDLAYQNPGLSFKVSLRSDVYAAVRLEDESADKFSGNVIWQAYSLHEIFVMLIMRVQTFLGKSFDEKVLMNTQQKMLSQELKSIMVTEFEGNGLWNKVPIHQMLLTLIRKRPRDLVKLCTLAARKASEDESNIITSKHFQAVFEEFSLGVISDTVVEFKSELTDIKRLIFGMKPNKQAARTADSFIYTTAELKTKINNINQSGSFKFANGRTASSQEIIQFLYKINFLTARKVLEDGTIQRKYFEENNYLSSKSVDFGYDWEVHVAYRWALQPDNLDDLLKNYRPSEIL
ncbi:hypothetical protein AR687_16370 [Flavobacteriaceae bacterium CRH]|nr:hypothetical protein AR687_16370 [Flavobacteriaceae bacterium CRH]